jgi:alpha-galactosidase
MNTTTLLVTSSVLIMGTMAAKFDDLAMAPPMGWNSWNLFKKDITEKDVIEMAEELVNTGMAEAGYEYIVLDTGWRSEHYERPRLLLADQRRFPRGMRFLADYIHAKGLRFGIYASPDATERMETPVNSSREFFDALTYSHWDLDYLKYDWYYLPENENRSLYALKQQALYSVARPVVFNFYQCDASSAKNEEGNPIPQEHPGNTVENDSKRTTNSRVFTKKASNTRISKFLNPGSLHEENDWFKNKSNEVVGVLLERPDSWDSMMELFDRQKKIVQRTGSGHWNDPGMLDVGNDNMTTEEYRTHFSLWCMLAAPLMTGNDLRNMSKETLSILTNREMVSIDQDTSGLHAFCFCNEDDYEIWIKPLESNGKAACLLNRSNRPRTVEVIASLLLRATACGTPDDYLPENYIIRDVWRHEDLHEGDIFCVVVPPHGVVVLKFVRKDLRREEELWMEEEQDRLEERKRKGRERE